MKRFFALLLALVMLLSLCACAKKPTDISIEYDDETVKKLTFTMGDDEEDDIILTAVLEPEDAEGDITWETEDKSVVKIRDNGDGTCTLTLRDEGRVKLTASCGDLEATVKVTVEADPAEAPAEEAPAAEEVIEIAPVEEAAAAPAAAAPGEIPAVVTYNSYGIYNFDGNFPSTPNTYNLPFTPDDVYNSGILFDTRIVLDDMRERIAAMESGSASDYFAFGNDGTIAYEYSDGLFRAFEVSRADSGLTVSITPKYDNANMLQSFDLYMDGVSYNLSWTGGTAITSLILKGSDGTNMTLSEAYDEFGIKEETGGFSAWFGANEPYLVLELGKGAGDTEILELTCDGKEASQGLGIWMVEIRNPLQSVEHRMEADQYYDNFTFDYYYRGVIGTRGSQEYRAFIDNNGDVVFKCINYDEDYAIDYFFTPELEYQYGYWYSFTDYQNVYVDYYGSPA